MAKQNKPKLYTEDDLKDAFNAAREAGPYSPKVNYFYGDAYVYLDWLKAKATRKYKS